MLWVCFSNSGRDMEVLAACLAEVELLAQVRLLRALLVFYRDSCRAM